MHRVFKAAKEKCLKKWKYQGPVIRDIKNAPKLLSIVVTKHLSGSTPHDEYQSVTLGPQIHESVVERSRHKDKEIWRPKLREEIHSEKEKGDGRLQALKTNHVAPEVTIGACGQRNLVENMINLFKIKDKKNQDAESANGRPPLKKQSAGELRLHKDISELNLPKTTTISFPNGKDDLMNFEISIRPDEGFYLGGTFMFTFLVPSSYPHEPPKVKCKTKVYHPNIDLEGNVCLNILREDWKPVLNINTIIYGLNHLFTQPNHEDPLNHDAAGVLRDHPRLFETNVRRAMAGGYVGQVHFPRCL